MVYEAVLTREEPIVVYRASACLRHPAPTNHCPGIFLTNKQMHDEAYPFIFDNTIKLELVDHKFCRESSVYRHGSLIPWIPIPKALSPGMQRTGYQGTTSLDGLHRFRHVEIEYDFGYPHQLTVFDNVMPRTPSKQESYLFAAFYSFVVALGGEERGIILSSTKAQKTIKIVISNAFYVNVFGLELIENLQMHHLFEYLKYAERRRVIQLELERPGCEREDRSFETWAKIFRDEIDIADALNVV